MTDFTDHLRLPIPDFTQEPWHAELEAAIRAVDAVVYQALVAQNVLFWTNVTVFSVGELVIDPDTGILWTCGFAHTSSASPVTFSQERNAHPEYWNATANIPQQRGNWGTVQTYSMGDFVIESNRYAVCLVGHISGVFNTDVSNGFWSILIDLSSLGVGINSEAEDTIASAGTTTLASKTATRLNVTGVTAITSFGIGANLYKILRYAAGIVLTNGANLILLGGANRTTELNDIGIYSSSGTSVWREISYFRASGVPLGVPDASTTVKGIIEIATQAEVNTGADSTRAVASDTLAVRLSALSTSIINTILGGVGASLDTLNEIAVAIGLLAPKANPTFTGTSNFDAINVTGTAAFAAEALAAAAINKQARAFSAQLLHVRCKKNANTDGATITEGSFQVCELTDTITNEIASATRTGNVLSLPAGTYHCEAIKTVAFDGANTTTFIGTWFATLRLRDTTNNTSKLVGKATRFGGTIISSGTPSFNGQWQINLKGRFTLAGTANIELQQYVSSSNGVVKDGVAINVGEEEIYTDVEIYRVA